MPFIALPRFSAPVRRWVVWCLLIALPLSGLSASLTEMLGPRHLHREMVVVGELGMNGWRDFRRSGVADDARPHVKPHSHGVFERHHHDRTDTTIVAIDGHVGDASNSEGDVAVTYVASAFGTSNDLAIPVASVASAAWTDRVSAAFSSCEAGRWERPPQA